MVDLTGTRPVPEGILLAMANAIIHRGPDEEGYFEGHGVGLASRRLSIVGLADGKQPITNESGSVTVVYNGELFDFREKRAELAAQGHRFATSTDTEILPHLWEDHGEKFFEQLRGQFALALWDRTRRQVILARDRFGICPLFWTRQRTSSGEWLLFASEIKALLATGLVEARPNHRGINHVFTFFAMPGPLTAFEGVNCLLPGHYISITLGTAAHTAPVRVQPYFQIDFPDRGHENSETNPAAVIADFERVLQRAVDKRLRADVPVVAYLSGGVDSSTVVALAGNVRGNPVPTFTIQIDDPKLDETNEATLIARHLCCNPVVVKCGAKEILDTYPSLIRAAEGPVIDTACAALLLLAREVHSQGYKVALTGEGADEWLAGYPWYKVHRLLSFLDVIPGLQLSQLSRRAYLRLTGAPRFPWSVARRLQAVTGGHNAFMDIYGLMSMSKLRFYSRQMHDTLGDHIPYADIGINLDRLKRWHPLNRSLYFGARIMLPGLLLASKGDRVAMNSSVETRYPFLDEDVYDFCAGLRPSWKLHGLREKYALRLLAERWLPRKIAWRPKAMFRAPFDSFHGDHPPAFVDQLLSTESLRRTGYFEPDAVHSWRASFRHLREGSNQRLSVEMGLVGVLSTQLWHHTYIDPSLADLASLVPAQRPALVYES
jgi:asparagine synthase (glutamine-hydrolysing)